jgi:hypothetical protein
MSGHEADLPSHQADIERSIKFFEDVSLIEDCNEVAGKLLIEAENKVSDLDQELKHLRKNGDNDASLKYSDEYASKVSRVSSELSYAKKVAKTHTTTLAMFHEDAKHFGVLPPVKKLLAIMLTAQHRLPIHSTQLMSITASLKSGLHQFCQEVFQHTRAQIWKLNPVGG